MKKFCFGIFAIGLLSIALLSCTGNNNANQQPVAVPTAQEQPAQPAATDPAQAQPAATDPAQAQPAATSAVPEAINAFVKQYFPNATIVGIEPDNEHGGPEYDIYLSDGTEIDFDANNQWDNVDCHCKAVPAALIPQAIATYVKNNYQNIAITKIDKDYQGFDIELANGLDLNFDSSGRFLGIDD